METEVSTSTKPKAIDPFLSLPQDILVKIIGYTSIAQWPSLESVDKNFRDATLIAWRQLRSINLGRELFIKFENANDQTAFGESVESTLQKLVERSSFLTSLSGVYIPSNAASNQVVTHLLAQFEHLHSITMGEVNEKRGISLENVVEFLESTRSRTSLKELILFDVFQWRDHATILDRFAASFVNGREIQSPLKLEKFSFTSSGNILHGIRLETMDTTRLTDVRLGKVPIEPDQLINLIGRASYLRQIEFSFLNCPRICNGQHFQANKELLTALANHENLTAIKFGGNGCAIGGQCTNFMPEFIEMLENVGRRGQLRKLALEEGFVRSTDIMDEVCASIRAYLPSLQSIKLWMDGMQNGMSDGSVGDVISLENLEEIEFTNVGDQVTASTIEKIAQLSKLKRLALDGLNYRNAKSLKYLADVKSLVDVRILQTHLVTADVVEKWVDGLASNLEIIMLGGNVGNEHDENGLIRILEKAGRLRVLIFEGIITDRVLMAIARSCPELEILGVPTMSEEITVQCLQEIVNRCTKLKRLGGIRGGIRNQLHIPSYKKIGNVDMRFWKYDFDSDEYD